MIKKIIVVSRRYVEKMLKELARINTIEGDWALISIYNDKLLIDIKEMEILKVLGCDNHISLRFDDITKDRYDIEIKNNRKLNLFTKDQAEIIVNFINSIIKKPEIKTLVIHCAAGISRSGAVGLFACRYLHLSEYEFRSYNQQICPNEYVYDLLSDVSGLGENYTSFWENSPGGIII
jgi:predicted protein tyrosine phosphatase